MERKCALYCRYSIDNKEMIEKQKNELIKYCKEYLEIMNYELFVEIGSVDKKRPVFDELMKRIRNKEFTDLLVQHPNRIYRAEYDKRKFDDIIMEINRNGVSMHSIQGPTA